MKRVNIVIAVVAVAILLAIGSAQTNKIAPEPDKPSSLVGRYQLVSGEHEIINQGGGSSLTEKAIFRIDTVTGATSYYVNALSGNSKPYIDEWRIIDESIRSRESLK